VTSDGVLVIDKPAGPTSHDVVAAVRRALGISRIGHTGTLDPLATGVLPLVVGRATRLATFMSGADKEYVARIRFGSATDTYDAEGRATGGDPAMNPAHADDIRAVLPRFSGRFLQQPPPFSAKKIAGTPGYKLARRNTPVEIKPVDVHVRDLELQHYADGAADLRLVCSSGFYVRSFAHDLGAVLRCGAHLEGLRRTRAGVFGLEVAHSLGDVIAEGPAAAARMVPMDQLLTDMPAAVLNDEGVRRASHGNTLAAGDFERQASAAMPAAGDQWRLLDGSGKLIGIADAATGGVLHPSIVLV
jgi:tRNA pseudouridine55 synthase